MYIYIYVYIYIYIYIYIYMYIYIYIYMYTSVSACSVEAVERRLAQKTSPSYAASVIKIYYDLSMYYHIYICIYIYIYIYTYVIYYYLICYMNSSPSYAVSVAFFDMLCLYCYVLFNKEATKEQ